jgi:hypothetical protein
MARRYKTISWQKISANIYALRSAENLVGHNNAIADFACKYLSPINDEYSEKWCDGIVCWLGV